MESKTRLPLLRQSSLAPRGDSAVRGEDESDEEDLVIESDVRLMYMANEGDLDGITELLDSGTSVNFKDIDDRTALHVAACQGKSDVVELLLKRGAQVDPKDRWGSTVSVVSDFSNVVYLIVFVSFFFEFV